MGNVLLWIISFLVVLGPLILIHEFGHFIACRLIGVTVLEFGFGFPPRAVKLFERGGTEFTLNWLPIGGFVRPLGEDFVKPVGEQATQQERAAWDKHQAELERLGQKSVKAKSVMEAGPWQRMLFVGAGAGMNFVGAIVIFIIAALLGRPAPAAVIVNTALNSPALAANLQYGDVITAINGQPINSSDQADAILKDLEGPTTSKIDLTLLRGDQTVHITLEPTTTGGIPHQGVFILSAAPNSPAAAVFQEKDIILKADKLPTNTVDTLKKYVDAHAGQKIVLTINRNGQQMTVDIVPRANPPEGEGAMGVTIAQITYDTYFGFALGDNAIKKATPGEAISYGFSQTWDVTKTIVMAPVDIITGKRPLSDARPLGPAGIAQASSAFVQESIQSKEPYPILSFAALISVALGITQLLPIPGLDGGRILFIIVELLRGKPMEPEREGMIHLIGLMLLLGLVAILTVNDLLHPITQVLSR
jgi:regulator of sigma E protease